jgi:uncharacterized protein (DUF486 family)
LSHGKLPCSNLAVKRIAPVYRRSDFILGYNYGFLCNQETHAKLQNQDKILTMITILLLLISNIFMTFAWYGHLKYQNVPLWKVTMISWGIAFFEYCFQVPANRIGSHTFNAAQLKTIQEIITLVVFSGFSIWYLKQDIKWNYAVGFFFIVVAAFFIFKKW